MKYDSKKLFRNCSELSDCTAVVRCCSFCDVPFHFSAFSAFGGSFFFGVSFAFFAHFVDLNQLVLVDPLLAHAIF